MTPQETFVTRLRRHRQRHRISLGQIAADTRVKLELLEALERNDLSQWPRGVYARAWIRAYADAVGLDPVDTVDEFCRLFPHGDRRVRPTIEEIAAIVAHPSDYQPEVPPEQERRRSAQMDAAMARMPWHVAATNAVASASRALRMRAAALMTAAHVQARDKRAPRTS
jgi:cytoskeletal protein RodZ